ncbi:MAG: NapC/NirT family cytochrome c [Bryobacteraceae bacterium]|nr:NapC/NirT family cytochrome c [Bryobacteraceae bacterium]
MAEETSKTFGGEQGWLKPFVHLADNLISKIGFVLLTTAGVAWLFVLPVETREGASHPYLGILFFLILPAMFFLGLALVPLGMFRKLRRERKTGTLFQRLPPLAWSNPELRRLVKLIGIATIANIVIGGYYTHATVSYMDSAGFCGTACHVMTPEYTAYVESPHVNVPCVECHVGAGTQAYIQSKWRGVGQLVAVTFNTYEKPIPTPVHTLRPARETCEQCHWPQKFGGYRLRVWDKFAEDEQNTNAKTVLVMRIGGGSMTTGIHGFHVAPGINIEYAADPKRQTIPWVRYTSAEGKSVEYASEEWTPENQASFERRTMDCLDCHTRPSHQFFVPERALDIALSTRVVDASLPWAKKKGLEILRASYASTEEADARIPEAFREFYRNEHADVFKEREQAVEKSAQGLLSVWRRNVFPEMNVTWGVYPDQIGHTDFPGCFRCHDEMHTSSDGQVISQDCSACHEVVALEETKPEILGKLGIHE